MAAGTTCPICKGEAAPRAENAASPFCSERCRYVDLGNWLDENYRVPTMITERTFRELVPADESREH